MPRTAAFGKEIFGRVFNHMDAAGLLGAATVILGILVVLIGLTLNG